MAVTLRAVILPYKLSFVTSEIPLVKLKQDFADGSSKEKKHPIFNNENGIKALFYINDTRFRIIVNCMLLWNTGIKLFNGFKEVLINMVWTNWEDIVAPIIDADKTATRF
jgi:hypothetical protein